jgi:hypothetical protein
MVGQSLEMPLAVSVEPPGRRSRSVAPPASVQRRARCGVCGTVGLKATTEPPPQIPAPPLWPGSSCTNVPSGRHQAATENGSETLKSSTTEPVA